MSETVKSAEDFENADLSTLTTELASDYDTKIVMCGNGAFYQVGSEVLKVKYNFLSEQYKSYNRVGSYYTYNPVLFYRVGDLIFVLRTTFSSMNSDFTNFIFLDTCLSTNASGNYISYSATDRIWTTSGLKCSIVGDVDLGGYVVKDENGNILSKVSKTAKDCFINAFLGLDIDNYFPADIDLDYYPRSDTATEEKKIVINNTYNYTTNVNDVYDYDRVGTLAGTVTDKDNSDIVQGNGNTNITINNNVNTGNDLDYKGLGEAISSFNFSAITDLNFSGLLEASEDYFYVIKGACSILPAEIWSVIGLGISSAVLLRFFKR